MRRMERVGFLQNHIYSHFGYFPWICVACKKTTLLRKRRELKRRSAPGEKRRAGTMDEVRSPVGDERRVVPGD
jgi:hypothetical protein